MFNFFVTELLHLHPAGRTICGSHRGGRFVQFGNHVGSDLFAQVKMISAQPPAADHAAAVAFQILQGKALYSGKQPDGAVGIILNF